MAMTGFLTLKTSSSQVVVTVMPFSVWVSLWSIGG
jgi:hypothetical protein